MSRKIHLSQQARRDIEQAYLYIRQDAPERAARWRLRLQATIQSLKSFPERHAVVFDAAVAGREVRQMTFGVYSVLYSVQADRIDILTIRHGARRPIEPGELPTSD
jgi:plasmid stabilization system protein ParE